MTALFTGLVFAFLVSTDAMAKDKSSDGESAIQFIELNPLILPIISERGVTQMVSLVVSVEVDSEEKANQVRKYQPRLTDAFLSDLYGTFSAHAARSGGQIPIPYLKQRLNALSGKVLGDHVVNDVLLQVMQKRQT
jgi:flagellar basal body-associated protein FliL